MPGGNPLAAGAPTALFDVRVPLAGNPYRTNYAVTANGQRFLVNTRVEDAVTPINVIFNWTALLKKLDHMAGLPAPGWRACRLLRVGTLFIHQITDSPDHHD